MVIHTHQVQIHTVQCTVMAKKIFIILQVCKLKNLHYSDRSIEGKLTTPLRNYDKQTNQQTNRLAHQPT